LQQPGLKGLDVGLLPEHFENSENREIFVTWQQSDKIEQVKTRLEPAIHEHLDSLLTRKLLSDKIEQKYAECALRLRENFLRSLKTKAKLAQEEAGGGITGEQEIAINSQLKEIQAQRRQMSLGQMGVRT